jgi:hypothetical protein
MAPGEQVWVGKRSGTVHYVGGVEFAKGIWVGVQLDLAVGEWLFRYQMMFCIIMMYWDASQFLIYCSALYRVHP